MMFPSYGEPIVMKRLSVDSVRGTFPVQPFLGIKPAEGVYPPPEIGPGFIWRHEEKPRVVFVSFVVSPHRRQPEFSVEHLLRAVRAVYSVETIDIFHPMENTLCFCWGVAKKHLAPEWERTLQEKLGREVFQQLREEVFHRYQPDEEERVRLTQALIAHRIPFTQ